MRISTIVTVAGIAAVAAGMAFADTPVPHQKDGLWESSMMMEGKPFTTQSCVTEESQAKMSIFSAQMRQKTCKSSHITHNMDGSWTSESTCEFSPGHVRTTRGEVTGDFNSKVSISVYSDGKSTPDMHMTMAWMGPCKPGMKGGDVMMSNGMKMNMLDGTMSGIPAH